MICTSSLQKMARPPGMAGTEGAVSSRFDHRGRDGLPEPLLKTQGLPPAHVEGSIS